MSIDPKVTIAIPTYNRYEDISQLVQQILSNKNISNRCEILVIDDGSTDRTNEVFCNENFLTESFTYLRNEKNIGYSKTFIRLFKECKTEYILTLADDNLILAQGFDKALECILQYQPSFISSPFLQNKRIAHRNWRRNAPDGKLTLDEFFKCSAHAPGLIFNCNDARKYLNKIDERIQLKCSFSMVYPQVNLALSMLLDHENCRYLSFPIGTENAAHPSGITDASGQSWGSYRSFLKQASDLDEYISTLETHQKKMLVLAAQKYFLSKIIGTSDEEIEKYLLYFLLKRFSSKKILRKIKSPFKIIKNFFKNGF
jgi:glycosyltransferase involved in cell wall biosynthesis